MGELPPLLKSQIKSNQEDFWTKSRELIGKVKKAEIYQHKKRTLLLKEKDNLTKQPSRRQRYEKKPNLSRAKLET
jgi:hypothetical protein